MNLPFLFCFTLYLGAIFQVQAPRGLIFGERFNRGVFALPVWEAYIWRGLFLEFYGINEAKNVNKNLPISKGAFAEK